MVDQTQVMQASSLYAQWFSYQNVLPLFDRPLKISAFTVVPLDDDGAVVGSETTISAEGIQSPPQMISGIKQQIETRLASINNSLKALGVPLPTVSEQLEPPPPEPEPEESEGSQPSESEDAGTARHAPRTQPRPAPKPQPKQNSTPPSRRR